MRQLFCLCTGTDVPQGMPGERNMKDCTFPYLATFWLERRYISVFISGKIKQIL